MRFAQSCIRMIAKGFMNNSIMMLQRMISITALTLVFGMAASAQQQESATPQITEQDLLGGLKNPTRWLTFSGVNCFKGLCRCPV